MSHNALKPDQIPQAPLAHSELDIADRSNTLRTLFPYDYEYVEQSGIADRFKYDPETGEDALAHILAGNIISLPGEGYVFCGFHHEPSAELAWPFVQEVQEDGSVKTVNVTRVLPLKPPGELTERQREKFARYPGDPFIAAEPVIGGMKKVITSRKKETGELRFVPQTSAMYPDDHDALAVVKKVLYAYDNAEHEGEVKTSPVTGKVSIHTDGYAPLLDGKTMMHIRVVTTAEPNKADRKIVAAFPIPEDGRMKLTEEQYDELVRQIGE